MMVQPQQKLGFGLMRLPTLKDGAIDIPLLSRLVDRFLEEGFTYFDTAYIYHNGASEKAVRKVLTERHERSAYTVATKMPHNDLTCAADVDRTFQEQLDRTGLGYFDYYLLHGINNRNWERYERFGCWEHARRMQEAGLIRCRGFSFHGTPDLLEKLLNDHPETEFVQLQINYMDWENPAIRSRECYEIVRRHGLPITVMEPVKGGLLAGLPDAVTATLRQCDPDASPAAWALRYCAQLEGVIAVLSGMNSMEQLEDNMATLKAPRPLTATESEALQQAAAKLLSAPVVPCTSCRYCVKGCPAGLEIPKLISVLNDYRLFGHNASVERSFQLFCSGAQAPSGCIACGQCEGACPQHLPIIETLKELDQALSHP